MGMGGFSSWRAERVGLGLGFEVGLSYSVGGGKEAVS